MRQRGTVAGTPSDEERNMLLVVHTGRPEAVRTARIVAQRLGSAGVTVRVLKSEADHLRCPDAVVMPVSPQAAHEAEMVLVIGGDGTLLRATEIARPAGTPLLGVNLGHVGFLAETEPEVLSDAVDHVLAGRYYVEQRMTIDVTVRQNGTVLATTWALNEATVEKAARERMLDLVTEVDGRPLSRWGCDGLVFATPTGSTAYAFSAGGPVVWPDVEALLLVPISAHALFAGPMVVSPESVLAAEVIGATSGYGETTGAVLWCDGRRMVDLPPGARVEVRRGALPVHLARLRDADVGASFTDRLVAKFGLPVAGWRGRIEARDARQDAAARKRDEEPAGDA
ncbi:MAG TPA: NAD kinase [Streptosporangiaceae bacterium]